MKRYLIFAFLVLCVKSFSQIPLWQLEYAPDSLHIVGAYPDGEPVWKNIAQLIKSDSIYLNNDTLYLRDGSGSVTFKGSATIDVLQTMPDFLGFQVKGKSITDAYLSNMALTPGTYGSASSRVVVTVSQAGRITGISAVSDPAVPGTDTLKLIGNTLVSFGQGGGAPFYVTSTVDLSSLAITIDSLKYTDSLRLYTSQGVFSTYIGGGGIDSTLISGGFGINVTESPANTFNISADTTEIATLYDVSLKQDALISGTNIKTVNSNSLLGSGNVSVGTVKGNGAANKLAYWAAADSLAYNNNLGYTSGGNFHVGTTSGAYRVTSVAEDYAAYIGNAANTRGLWVVPESTNPWTVEVLGNTKLSGTILNSSGSAGSSGQVLTSQGSGNWTWTTPTTGTVTSVGLTTGTSGTDVNVSGSPVTSSGTITLNIPTASATNRGALSSADWTTFNNKIGSLNGLTGATQTLATSNSNIGFTITSSGSTHTFNLPYTENTTALRLGQNAKLGSSNSVAIGQNAGNTDMSNAIAIGRNALQNSTATNNVAVGLEALKNLTSGIDNVSLGSYAGASLTTGQNNIALGTQALTSATTATDNVAIGRSAGRITNGTGNIFIGSNSGFNNTAQFSINIGRSSGFAATGSYNMFIGDNSGYNNTGSNNTFIGENSGDNSGSMSNSVLIGRYAGRYVTRSQSLIINNDFHAAGLITGQFDNKRVGINQDVTDITRTLDINGEVRIRDLVTTTPTLLVSADANGVLSSTTIGSGLSLSGGTLSATGALTGSGAATRLAFWDGTTSLSSNANAYWDNTNSRMGIGTTSPQTSLHIAGTTGMGNGILMQNINSLTSGNRSQLILSQGTGTGFASTNRYWSLRNEMTSTSNADFRLLYWNGTTEQERMRIDHNGIPRFQYLAGGGTGLVTHTNSGDLYSTFPSGSSGESLRGDLTWVENVNVQVFTSSGSWSKPTGAKYVTVICIGGGGGGAGGSKQASGVAANGGGGGQGGGFSKDIFVASTLPSSVSVTVGLGGTGGVGATTNSSLGNSGNAGGTSSFGSYLNARGGGGGANQGVPVYTSWEGYGANDDGGIGASWSSATTQVGAGNTRTAPTGGGCGGGITASNTLVPPIHLGSIIQRSGGASGYIGGNGSTGGEASIMWNGSNGTAVSTSTYGQGGGGGGAARNLVGNAGNGAAGRQGVVVVITHF